MSTHFRFRELDYATKIFQDGDTWSRTRVEAGESFTVDSDAIQDVSLNNSVLPGDRVRAHGDKGIRSL